MKFFSPLVDMIFATARFDTALDEPMRHLPNHQDDDCPRINARDLRRVRGPTLRLDAYMAPATRFLFYTGLEKLGMLLIVAPALALAQTGPL